MKITLTTTPKWLDFEKGILELTINQTTDDMVNKYTEQFSREVYNLREQTISEALIKLGWTPPPEETK